MSVKLFFLAFIDILQSVPSGSDRDLGRLGRLFEDTIRERLRKVSTPDLLTAAKRVMNDPTPHKAYDFEPQNSRRRTSDGTTHALPDNRTFDITKNLNIVARRSENFLETPTSTLTHTEHPINVSLLSTVNDDSKIDLIAPLMNPHNEHNDKLDINKIRLQNIHNIGHNLQFLPVNNVSSTPSLQRAPRTFEQTPPDSSHDDAEMHFTDFWDDHDSLLHDHHVHFRPFLDLPYPESIPGHFDPDDVLRANRRASPNLAFDRGWPSRMAHIVNLVPLSPPVFEIAPNYDLVEPLNISNLSTESDFLPNFPIKSANHIPERTRRTAVDENKAIDFEKLNRNRIKRQKLKFRPTRRQSNKKPSKGLFLRNKHLEPHLKGRNKIEQKHRKSKEKLFNRADLHTVEHHEPLNHLEDSSHHEIRHIAPENEKIPVAKVHVTMPQIDTMLDIINNTKEYTEHEIKAVSYNIMDEVKKETEVFKKEVATNVDKILKDSGDSMISQIQNLFKSKVESICQEIHEIRVHNSGTMLTSTEVAYSNLENQIESKLCEAGTSIVKMIQSGTQTAKNSILYMTDANEAQIIRQISDFLNSKNQHKKDPAFLQYLQEDRVIDAYNSNFKHMAIKTVELMTSALRDAQNLINDVQPSVCLTSGTETSTLNSLITDHLIEDTTQLMSGVQHTINSTMIKTQQALQFSVGKSVVHLKKSMPNVTVKLRLNASNIVRRNSNDVALRLDNLLSRNVHVEEVAV